MPSRYERNKKKRKSARRKKKRSLFKKFLIFLAFVLIIFIVYGKFAEPNILTINEYKIADNDIPSSFDGVKIVHFSDIHYKGEKNKARTEKLIDKINEVSPDVIVFTGDLIDKNYVTSDDDLKFVTDSLSRMESKLGKYAVIGEDDFYNDNFDDIMYDAGFKVLKNNYDTIYNETNVPIVIYGIDNVSYGVPKTDILNSTFIDNISYKIVAVHESDYVDEFTNNKDINLILAGHSHNGYIGIPGVDKFMAPKGSKKYYEKYYNISNTDLYVSGGIGSHFTDFRLFNNPSFNVYRFSTK